MLTKCPKGTKDVTPSQSYKWHYLENIIRSITSLYGYREVRTPTFEHTELFLRGIGDTTDVVQKEMYTFLDKGNRSITLKPEGTAGVVRAYLENNIANEALPAKMYYLTPVFRYENPQSGRLREHHQFGIEIFGAPKASIDAEVISLALNVFNTIGLKGVKLNINSIGCPKCRVEYNKALHLYLEKHLDKLCALCQSRAEKNPMRIIDCKNKSCQDEIKDIPMAIDYLCDECKAHFQELKDNLDALGIAYSVNKRIVRGLDYYTKTVIEFIAEIDGSELTICGGGRYDSLVEQIGGAPTSGIGFGMGLERLLLVMEKNGIQIPEPNLFDVYIASIGDEAQTEALKKTAFLRSQGIKTDCDHVGRSIKAQFKYADKIKAPIVLVIGEDEINNGVIKLRDMRTGCEITVEADKITETIKGVLKQ